MNSGGGGTGDSGWFLLSGQGFFPEHLGNTLELGLASGRVGFGSGDPSRLMFFWLRLLGAWWDSSFFFFFFGCACGIQRFPGQGSNSHRSRDMSYSSDNVRSLNSRLLKNSLVG